MSVAVFEFLSRFNVFMHRYYAPVMNLSLTLCFYNCNRMDIILERGNETIEWLWNDCSCRVTCSEGTLVYRDVVGASKGQKALGQQASSLIFWFLESDSRWKLCWGAVCFCQRQLPASAHSVVCIPRLRQEGRLISVNLDRFSPGMLLYPDRNSVDQIEPSLRYSVPRRLDRLCDHPKCCCSSDMGGVTVGWSNHWFWSE